MFETAQQIWDHVYPLLQAQGGRSVEGETHNSMAQCMLRGANGRKCAIGHCIPDEKFKPWMEAYSGLREKIGYDDDTDAQQRAILAAAGIPESLRAFAVELQTFHDRGTSWLSDDRGLHPDKVLGFCLTHRLTKKGITP